MIKKSGNLNYLLYRPHLEDASRLATGCLWVSSTWRRPASVNNRFRMGQLVVLALLYISRTPGTFQPGFYYDWNALMTSLDRIQSPGEIVCSPCGVGLWLLCKTVPALALMVIDHVCNCCVSAAYSLFVILTLPPHVILFGECRMIFHQSARYTFHHSLKQPPFYLSHVM